MKLTHFNHGCPNRLSNFNTSRMQFQDVKHRRLLRRSQIPKHFLLEIKANCFHVIGVNVFPRENFHRLSCTVDKIGLTPEPARRSCDIFRRMSDYFGSFQFIFIWYLLTCMGWTDGWTVTWLVKFLAFLWAMLRASSAIKYFFDNWF